MSRHACGRRSRIGASLDYDRQVTAELGHGCDTVQARYRCQHVCGTWSGWERAEIRSSRSGIASEARANMLLSPMHLFFEMRVSSLVLYKSLLLPPLSMRSEGMFRGPIVRHQLISGIWLSRWSRKKTLRLGTTWLIGLPWLAARNLVRVLCFVAEQNPLSCASSLSMLLHFSAAPRSCTRLRPRRSSRGERKLMSLCSCILFGNLELCVWPCPTGADHGIASPAAAAGVYAMAFAGLACASVGWKVKYHADR